MNNNVFKIISSKKEYYILLIYMIFGCFFITSSFEGESYLNILLAVVSNKIFLVIFFYPSFIYLWHLVTNYMNNDSLSLLRAKNRKNYVFLMLKQLFFATILVYFQYIIIQLICVNITEHTDFTITYNLGYNVNDFIVLLVCFLRTFLNLLVFCLFTFLFFEQSNRRELGLIAIFGVLMIIYFSGRYYPSKIIFLNFLNLGFQFYGVTLCNNILYFIFSNILFFIVVSLFLFYILLKKIRKINFNL